MKHLVEFPLKDGGKIVVEVDEPECEGSVRAGRGDLIIKARDTLEESLNNVLPSVRHIAECLRYAVSSPDQVEVTFGIKFSAQAGAIIACAGIDANFGVTVRWTPQKEALP